MLTLRKGSLLVVNASKDAIEAGQTSPRALLRYLDRGVRIFSVENLHAKVFVLGRRAFVGSTNVSSSSKESLIEAVLETTDPRAVLDARRFIDDLARQELGREALRSLVPLEPKGSRARGGASQERTRRKKTRFRPLRVEHLTTFDMDESELLICDAGEREARKQKREKRKTEIQSFRITGKTRHFRGDYVLQIVDEHRGDEYVEPVGFVLRTKASKPKRGKAYFVYVEVRRCKRRPRFTEFCRKLWRGAKKQLGQSGTLTQPEWVDRIHGYWKTRLG
ncbi:MAG: hypothetical protein HZA61_04025 [Candidatus Eisenbacteria bacterium]|uniref:PLD phosphodiesterase domain-containing protein n=1 Tax=Eiseniibacteriota bacterium TaxID=2212470 RepID=A0A933SAN1_UNCEI|nr:hypothetical protein [Candidatus Eisenbacteria bacterium]